MCEIEELAIAVEKHPCLWNTNHEDYHNRDLKDEAWESICQEIIKDWEDTDEIGRKHKFIDLKKKWTNVRDCYRKEVHKSNHLPNGSTTKKKKRYVHADVLSFLDPVFDRRNYDRKTETDESQQETITEVREIRNIQNSPNGSKIRIIEKILEAKEQKPNQLKDKRKEEMPNQSLNLQHQHIINADEDSDDVKFLLSFRSYMRKMSSSEKIEFKIGMLKLVQSCIEQSPSSSGGSQIVYIENPLQSPSRYEQNISPPPSHRARHSRNFTRYSSSPPDEEFLTKTE
ncbi:hypothetical protein evm_004008 [Chilo suppressalis]|nr:hypothetical protein evm_004008 [Chilo suppressalis]